MNHIWTPKLACQVHKIHTQVNFQQRFHKQNPRFQLTTSFNQLTNKMASIIIKNKEIMYVRPAWLDKQFSAIRGHSKSTFVVEGGGGVLKGCVHYIFTSLFCMSKREDLWNKEKCFLFHFESSFRSWDNQILNLTSSNA